jgi:hypothetical protein
VEAVRAQEWGKSIKYCPYCGGPIEEEYSPFGDREVEFLRKVIREELVRAMRKIGSS